MKTPSIFTSILLFTAAATTGLPAFLHADDHGDSFGTATTVTHGNYSGSLDSTSDIDVFKFTVTRTGMVALFTMGDADTYGRLYDAAGNYTGYSNGNSGSTYNFEFIRKFQPGTYYLAVSHGGNLTGAYTLGVRIQESSATVTGATRSASFSRAGDIDFFRVNIEQKGVCDFFSTGPVDTYASLYDNAGTYTGYSNNNSGADYNFQINRRAYGPGEYLLIVSHGGSGIATGNYTFQVRRPNLATRITGTGSLSRSFHVEGDIDLFKIEVPQNGEIQIYSTGSTDTFGYLYDYTGNYTGYSNNNSGSDYNFSIKRNLTSGVYYLRVVAGSGGVTGSYRINVIMPDNVNPRISITSPRSGARLRGRTTIRGRASDNAAVNTVSVNIYGKWYTASKNGTSWSKKFIAPRRGRRFRSMRVWAHAVDFSGNAATTHRTFRIKKR